MIIFFLSRTVTSNVALNIGKVGNPVIFPVLDSGSGSSVYARELPPLWVFFAC